MLSLKKKNGSGSGTTKYRVQHQIYPEMPLDCYFASPAVACLKWKLQWWISNVQIKMFVLNNCSSLIILWEIYREEHLGVQGKSFKPIRFAGVHKWLLIINMTQSHSQEQKTHRQNSCRADVVSDSCFAGRGRRMHRLFSVCVSVRVCVNSGGDWPSL